MPLKIEKVELQGLDHLQKSLVNLRDDRGAKWKRAAFNRAGKDAFAIVLRKAQSFAPMGKSGLTVNTMTTKASFKTRPPQRKRAPRYSIYTTYGAKFNKQAPRDYKNRPVRYPFMNEVGVPPQTYFRKSKLGNIHPVKREASRKPLLFQHRALGSTANRVVDIFTTNLGYYIDLAANTEYKTLPIALRKVK